MLNLVFYCIRTYVYYIYRQKQTLLGIWPGDLALKPKSCQKSLKLRKTASKPIITDILSNHTNTISVSVPQTLPTSKQLQTQTTFFLDHISQMQTSTSTALDPAVGADLGSCRGGLLGDTGQSASLNCSAGMAECSSRGGAADGCHDSLINSCSDPMIMGTSHSDAAVQSHFSNHGARVGLWGPVVQLSSVNNTPHHHQGSVTQ